MKEEIYKNASHLTKDDNDEIERLTEIYYPKETINWDIGMQAHVNFLRDTVKTGISIGYAAAKYNNPVEHLSKPEKCGCLDWNKKEHCDGNCHS